MNPKAATGFRANRDIGKGIGLIQVPATLGNQLLSQSAKLGLRLKRAGHRLECLP